MQVQKLKHQFDELQKRFGDPGLSSIYGAGCIHRPTMCFVFMNPTGRNVAADPAWRGLRAPWIGTKNVWKLFYKLDLIPADLFKRIQEMSPAEWTPDFARCVYQHLSDRRLYVTNLSKATQKDARPLPDAVFHHYLPAFYEEISAINPRQIVTFGNQVSSIITNEPIKVSETRRRSIPLNIGTASYPIYPTYYPVGQGMRNMDKAVEDIRWVIASFSAHKKADGQGNDHPPDHCQVPA